jgi:phosphoketolase
MRNNTLSAELRLKRPLTLADVKKMLLGHWGATPGQNFIYVQKCDGQYASQF